MKKNKLLIYGSGNFGKYIYKNLKDYFNIIGFADDTKKINTKVIHNLSVKHNLKTLLKNKIDCKIFLAIGYKLWSKRDVLIKKLKKKNYKFQSFIHPTSIVNKEVKFLEGVFISQGVNISSSSVISSNTFVDVSVTIGENTKIGKNCYLAAGSNICGNVKINDNSFVGAGTIVLDEIRIGKNCFINAGSLITNDLSNYTKYVELRKNFSLNKKNETF